MEKVKAAAINSANPCCNGSVSSNSLREIRDSISDPVSPVLVSPRTSESACRFGSSNFGIAAIGSVVLSAIPRAPLSDHHAQNHDYVFGTAGSGSPASPLLTRLDRKSAKGAISSSTLAFSRASM